MHKPSKANETAEGASHSDAGLEPVLVLSRILSEKDIKALMDWREAIIKAEREACAKVCESISGNEPSGHGGCFGALDCAEAIRMRSNA